MIVLSIIIPVYCVEKYIGGCLESIFSQYSYLEKLEVVIVDDGTPDKSMIIVDEYKKRYNNIRVIHQENQGLSAARNNGIAIATGQYIWFVDSDDQLTDNAFDILFSKFEKKPMDDYLGFDLLGVSEATGDESVLSIIMSKGLLSYYGKTLTRKDLLGIGSCPVQRWVFKRDFLISNGLQFHHGIIHEDVEFMGRAKFYARSVTVYKETLYRYLQRHQDSIMASLDMNSLRCRDLIINSLLEFKESVSKTVSDKIFLDGYIAGIIMNLLSSRESVNISDREYESFVSGKKRKYKKLLLNGLCAYVYSGYLKTALLTLLAFISFQSYGCLLGIRKKFK